MISDEDLECYRINYEPDPYEKAAAKLGSDLVVPLGAVYAIKALCDEVERLKALTWDECLDDALSPTIQIDDA